MNWSVKLAKSLINDPSQQRHRFIQRICQLAIALCLTTILISSFFIRGFEQKIEEKIFGFWAHIRVSSLTNSVNPIAEQPLLLDTNILQNIAVKTITPSVNKGLILKHKTNIEGIMLKGISLAYIRPNLITDKQNLPFDTAKEIPLILSTKTLDRVNAKVGSTVFVNIIDSTPKTYKAKVINAYYTNIEEFDAQVGMTDIGFLQKINGWQPQEYSWVELELKDKKHIAELSESLYQSLPEANVESIYTIFPQLFDWLALMKRNEIIIFIVMILVAMINIVGAIGIFIIEKTKLIGILKVLGARNRALFQLMYYQIIRIIFIGIVGGNILALLLTSIIYYLKPIKLDPTIYYVDYAPIAIDIYHWIFLNVLTILVCLISAFIPLFTISKISPVKVAEYR